MLWGLDLLGLSRFPDLALREQPAGWSIGCFGSGVFGNPYPALDRILATGRVPRVRVQCLWSDSHSFGPADLPRAIAEAKKLAPLIGKYPNVEFRVSPYCEHRLSGRDITQVLAAVQKVVPTAVMVNAPCPGHRVYLPGVVNELHGAETGPVPSGRVDFSFDGTPCVDADVEAFKRKYANAETFYFHEPRFNGRWEDNDKTPRPDRKGWPDSALIDSVIYLHRDKGAARLAKGWLYKSHSENKGSGDARAEKPVLIGPVKTREVRLVCDNGQVADVLRYYGPYSGGGFRYYASAWGYQTAEKARRIQGHPLVKVVADGKGYGTINPAFREGSYR